MNPRPPPAGPRPMGRRPTIPPRPLSPGQRLNRLWRRALPAASLVALLLAGLVPWPLPWLGGAGPWLGFAAVFHWVVHRPDLLPPPVAFLVGLAADLLTGGPPGLFAGLYLGAGWLIAGARRFLVGEPFAVQWLAAASLLLAAGMAAWLAMALWHLAPLSPVPAITAAALAAALHPFLAAALLAIQRRLMARI